MDRMAELCMTFTRTSLNAKWMSGWSLCEPMSPSPTTGTEAKVSTADTEALPLAEVDEVVAVVVV